MSAVMQVPSRMHSLFEEIAKLPAFFRRDLLIAWSYRMAFLSDWASLVVQLLMFSLIDRVVDPATLPVIDGERVSYLEYVTIGIAFAAVLQIGTYRAVASLREEQLMGTIESLLVTPSHPVTIQIGMLAYELAYVPLRIAVFLLGAATVFGLDLVFVNLLPAIAILVVFLMFACGLGMIGAAAILTFKQGNGMLSAFVAMMMLASGTYIPVGAMPSWLAWLASVNPLTVATDAVRSALLGGAGWAEVVPALLITFTTGVLAIAVGLTALHHSLKRERRLGTVGMY